MERQLKLDSIQFVEIDYKVKSSNPSVTNELGIQLDVKPVFDESESKGFGIVFHIGLNSKPKDFKMKITAVAHFSTTEDIDDDFKNSMFVSVNAPAIAFPFVRAFISNLTLNSGYDPVILPSFNFVKFSKDKSEVPNN